MKTVLITPDEGEPVACRIATSYADLSYKGAMQVLELAYCQPKTPETRLQIWYLVFLAPPGVIEWLLQPQHRDELLRLLECTEWAYQTGIEARPLNSFNCGNRTYLLPDEELRNLSTGEFITAVVYLLAFSAAAGSNSEKSDFLSLFLASICRPRQTLKQCLFRDSSTFNGDEREPFNSHQITARAQVFKSYPLPQKVAIMQWFLTAVGKMERLYGMPQPEGEAGHPLQLGAFVQDWERTVHSLAKEQNFGNYDAVMGRGIHDVMAYLELKKIELNEQQDELRKQRIGPSYGAAGY